MTNLDKAYLVAAVLSAVFIIVLTRFTFSNCQERMTICMIAAVGKNLELGKDNNLIWHFKDDMAFFKETTTGSSIIMGRKTFESLPKVLPRRKIFAYCGYHTNCHTLLLLLLRNREFDFAHVFIINKLNVVAISRIVKLKEIVNFGIEPKLRRR